jgi:hypothetical protein
MNKLISGQSGSNSRGSKIVNAMNSEKKMFAKNASPARQ